MKRQIKVFFLALLIILSAVVLPCGHTVPALAGELDYVTDTYGLLTDAEWRQLEKEAKAVSEQYGCGVYIVTVDNYINYGRGDVFSVTADIYHDYMLGEGSGRDGIVLLLSMRERDYALFVYGSDAEYAFDNHGLIMLENEFLDDLGNNRWYDGFDDYISTCEEFLALAEAGEPVRASKGPKILLVVGISMVISLIVCLAMGSGMKNVRIQDKADRYVADGGLKLSGKEDVFSHRTQTRTKIEGNSSSSGSRRGGGGSGRSGKF